MHTNLHLIILLLSLLSWLSHATPDSDETDEEVQDAIDAVMEERNAEARREADDKYSLDTWGFIPERYHSINSGMAAAHGPPHPHRIYTNTVPVVMKGPSMKNPRIMVPKHYPASWEISDLLRQKEQDAINARDPSLRPFKENGCFVYSLNNGLMLPTFNSPTLQYTNYETSNFYFGKGYDLRHLAHTREATAIKKNPHKNHDIDNVRKYNAIQSIWKDKGDVIVVHSNYMSEPAALIIEAALILKFGIGKDSQITNLKLESFPNGVHLSDHELKMIQDTAMIDMFHIYKAGNIHEDTMSFQTFAVYPSQVVKPTETQPGRFEVKVYGQENHGTGGELQNAAFPIEMYELGHVVLPMVEEQKKSRHKLPVHGEAIPKPRRQKPPPGVSLRENLLAQRERDIMKSEQVIRDTSFEVTILLTDGSMQYRTVRTFETPRDLMYAIGSGYKLCHDNNEIPYRSVIANFESIALAMRNKSKIILQLY